MLGDKEQHAVCIAGIHLLHGAVVCHIPNIVVLCVVIGRQLERYGNGYAAALEVTDGFAVRQDQCGQYQRYILLLQDSLLLLGQGIGRNFVHRQGNGCAIRLLRDCRQRRSIDDNRCTVHLNHNLLDIFCQHFFHSGNRQFHGRDTFRCIGGRRIQNYGAILGNFKIRFLLVLTALEHDFVVIHRNAVPFSDEANIVGRNSLIEDLCSGINGLRDQDHTFLFIVLQPALKLEFRVDRIIGNSPLDLLGNLGAVFLAALTGSGRLIGIAIGMLHGQDTIQSFKTDIGVVVGIIAIPLGNKVDLLAVIAGRIRHHLGGGHNGGSGDLYIALLRIALFIGPVLIGICRPAQERSAGNPENGIRNGDTIITDALAGLCLVNAIAVGIPLIIGCRNGERSIIAIDIQQRYFVAALIARKGNIGANFHLCIVRIDSHNVFDILFQSYGIGIPLALIHRPMLGEVIIIRNDNRQISHSGEVECIVSGFRGLEATDNPIIVDTGADFQFFIQLQYLIGLDNHIRRRAHLAASSVDLCLAYLLKHHFAPGSKLSNRSIFNRIGNRCIGMGRFKANLVHAAHLRITLIGFEGEVDLIRHYRLI